VADGARHESFLRHAGFRWLWVGLLLSAMAAAGYVWSQHDGGFHPSHAGGTWFGYASGILGAGLILWLTSLGLRKRAPTQGRWSLKGWVSAHVYLGLALLVIATLHSGLQFGWNLHTLAYVLLLLVIVSGLVGVIFYVWLPQRLSSSRGETTRKLIVEAIAALDRRLNDAALPLAGAQAALVAAAVTRTRVGGNGLQRLTGLHPACATARALRGLTGQSGVGDKAAAMVIVLLEEKQELLVKARRQIRLEALLRAWLSVHVPATFALLAALTAHIVSVFFYW